MKNASFYRQEGREILKNNWAEAVFACVIVSILPSILTFIPVIGTIACILLEGLFAVGIIVYFIKLKNTRKSDINEIFKSMKTNTWENISAFIVKGIFTILWSFVFIVVGIVKSYSYAMTMYLRTKKPELTTTQTITLSREIMYGKKWKLFCLQFSFIGWMLLCLLTFGIGFIILIPYIQASTIAFYEDAYKKHFGEEVLSMGETENKLYNGPIEIFLADEKEKNTDNKFENIANLNEEIFESNENTEEFSDNNGDDDE